MLKGCCVRSYILQSMVRPCRGWNSTSTEPRIFHVISIFCGIVVTQNMKITQKIPYSTPETIRMNSPVLFLYFAVLAKYKNKKNHRKFLAFGWWPEWWTSINDSREKSNTTTGYSETKLITVFHRISAPDAEAENGPLSLSDFNEIDNLNSCIT